MIRSICMVRLSALGDVLMAVPMVRTLQAHFPEAKLTWLISKPAYELVEGIQGIDWVLVPKPNTLKGYWALKKQMDQFKKRSFDVLLGLQASFRANVLYPFIQAPRKIGYDTHRAKDGHSWFVDEAIPAGNDHTLDGFLKFAKQLGASDPDLRWDLPITAADHAWANAQVSPTSPLIIVNPAASKPERSWQVERYVRVILEAKRRWQVQVALTGGPGKHDRQLADGILQQVNCLDFVGKTRPKQLLALIQRAQAVLCPDTGPSHMGAAVGTPVVALHAVTSADVSGPYLYRDLAVDCYPQAVKTILKKTLDENKWGTHVHGEEAMKLVQVRPVLEKLETIFS